MEKDCVRCHKTIYGEWEKKTCKSCLESLKEEYRNRKIEIKKIDLEEIKSRKYKQLTKEKLKSFLVDKYIDIEEEIYPLHPFSMKLIGSRGSGKTTYIINLLNIIGEEYDRVIWISGMTCGQELLKYLKIKVEMLNPESVGSVYDELIEKKEMLLLIFDDCMQELRNDKKVMNIYTKGRHLNCSVVTLEQHLHYSNNVERINTDVYMLFKINDYESIDRFRGKYCGELKLEELLLMLKLCIEKNYPLQINVNSLWKYRLNFNVELKYVDNKLEECEIEKDQIEDVRILKEKVKSRNWFLEILGCLCL